MVLTFAWALYGAALLGVVLVWLRWIVCNDPSYREVLTEAR